MRRVSVVGCSDPSGRSSPGSVTSTTSSVSRRSRSARRSSSSRPSIAASRRSRSVFSAIPVSRSRTSRSASFSALLRPRYSTRTCSTSSGVSRLHRARRAPPPRPPSVPRRRLYRDRSRVSPASFLLSRVSQGAGGPGHGDRGRNDGGLDARRCPGSVPGPRKQRRCACNLHVSEDSAATPTGLPVESADVSAYDAFAPIYGIWSADMTEDVDFYVSLAAEADGPVVELAVGTGRVAIPLAKRTGKPRRRNRLARRRCSPLPASELAATGQSSSSSGRSTCATSPLDEPAALVICPFRSLLHLPTWAIAAASSSESPPALRPGGRFAWNAFAFDHSIAARLDGHWHDEPVRHRIDYVPADCRIDITLDDGPRSRSGGPRAGNGRACSTSPASRSRRSTAGSTGARSTRRAASSWLAVAPQVGRNARARRRDAGGAGLRPASRVGQECEMTRTTIARSMTPGAGRSPRTSASTSTSRSPPAGPSSSSQSAPAGSRFRSRKPASG